MNTEALQQILEIVGQAGEGAFSLAVIYLVLPYFKTCVWAGLFWFIGKTIANIIGNITFVHHAAKAVKYSPRNEYIINSDREAILSLIAKGQSALDSQG